MPSRTGLLLCFWQKSKRFVAFGGKATWQADFQGCEVPLLYRQLAENSEAYNEGPPQLSYTHLLSAIAQKMHLHCLCDVACVHHLRHSST